MNTSMILSRNRKEIPPYQVVGKYDSHRLLQEINQLGLLDRSTWHQINFGDNEYFAMGHL